jgi:aquaporin Z
LAPALVSGEIGNLWLYWATTFIETSIIATIFRKKF